MSERIGKALAWVAMAAVTGLVALVVIGLFRFAIRFAFGS